MVHNLSAALDERVHHLSAALDERVPVPPIERYDLPCFSSLGSAHPVCGDFGPISFSREEAMLEEAIRNIPERWDHGRPLLDSASVSIPRNAPERRERMQLHADLEASAAARSTPQRREHTNHVQPSPDSAEGIGARRSPERPGQPAVDMPVGSDWPNVGKRKGMDALEEECRFNAGMLRKVRQLAETYDHWRPVRGDGNCYYRAVVFGALEVFLARGDAGAAQVAGALAQVHYDTTEEHNLHNELLKWLRTCRSSAELEEWIAQDAELDQALIRACRRLVRLFLIGHADVEMPSGLTYEALAQALDTHYTGIDDYCRRVVDPMGRDAETLALDALPLQLGVGLRVWILDRRDEVDLVSVDMPAPDGQVHVHVLFKPGHYDLLYLRPALLAAPASPSQSQVQSPVPDSPVVEEESESSDCKDFSDISPSAVPLPRPLSAVEPSLSGTSGGSLTRSHGHSSSCSTSSTGREGCFRPLSRPFSRPLSGQGGVCECRDESHVSFPSPARRITESRSEDGWQLTGRSGTAAGTESECARHGKPKLDTALGSSDDKLSGLDSGVDDISCSLPPPHAMRLFCPRRLHSEEGI